MCLLSVNRLINIKANKYCAYQDILNEESKHRGVITFLL